MCATVCGCVRLCACAYVRVYVRAYVRVRVHTCIVVHDMRSTTRAGAGLLVVHY